MDEQYKHRQAVVHLAENTPDNSLATELDDADDSDLRVVESFEKPPFKFDLKKIVPFILATAVALFVYFSTFMLSDSPSQRHCLSLLLFVCILWTTEAIPLHITSVFIPMLTVWMHVLVDDEGNMVHAKEASKMVFEKLFSSTVAIALGAFTISLALTKYHISYRLAALVLGKVGTSPAPVTAALMLLGLFLSMWISNVAAPVVCISLILPVIRDCREHGLQKFVLLGIAFSNNIAGMITPMSSPQNFVAISIIQNSKFLKSGAGSSDESGERYVTSDISWGRWLSLSIPMSFLGTALCFLILMKFYHRSNSGHLGELGRERLDPLGWEHAVVMAVSLLTVFLWGISDFVDKYLGSMGIVALLPVVTFYSLGLLDKNDFKESKWDVLLLLAGGLCLGFAIDNSGLLSTLSEHLSKVIMSANIAVKAMVFGGFTWLVGNFISHTVAAIIILPIIWSTSCAAAGGDCDEGRARLLVVLSVFMDSCAMALPVTSFPNAQSFAAYDARDQRILSTSDFIKAGALTGVLQLALMLLVGLPLGYFTGL